MSTPSRGSRLVTWLTWLTWLAIGVLLALLLPALGLERLQILLLLGFGWAFFLARTIPKISFNGELICTALLCVTGVLCLGHWFLRRLATQVAAARGKTWVWPWRWT